MENYNILKKRDGQDWKIVNSIFASDFTEAKKIFAKNMTHDNHNKSNNIVWLDKSMGVNLTGWYDLDASNIVANDSNEVDYSKSEMELFCSEDSINEGFDFWSEDVYSYKIQDVFNFSIEGNDCGDSFSDNCKVSADDVSSAKIIVTEMYSYLDDFKYTLID